jgi:hypothetical protein
LAAISSFQPRHTQLHGGVGHGDAPGERQPEHGLRQGDVAFHQRIDHHQQHRRNGEQDGQYVLQRGQQAKGDQRHRHEQAQRVLRGHATGGQRALAGTRHMRVDVAVGIVIDGAARRAHEHGAADEHQQDMQARRAIRRQPQRPQRGPEEQQDADGPVQAHQDQVITELGGERVHGQSVAPGRPSGSVLG